MNEQQKAVMHSYIFTGYVEETPPEDSYGIRQASDGNYIFHIHLISMKRDTGSDEMHLDVPKHFKIKAYCPRTHQEKKDDQYQKIDETLEKSLIPSIHVGFQLEFRGTAYKRFPNRDRHIVIPQQIKTANEIEMDRHHIRIMPPSQESVTRYKAYIKAEKEKKKKDRQINRKWKRESTIQNIKEEIKKNKIAIIIGVAAIITEIIGILVVVFIK